MCKTNKCKVKLRELISIQDHTHKYFQTEVNEEC